MRTFLSKPSSVIAAILITPPEDPSRDIAKDTAVKNNSNYGCSIQIVKHFTVCYWLYKYVGLKCEVNAQSVYSEHMELIQFGYIIWISLFTLISSFIIIWVHQHWTLLLAFDNVYVSMLMNSSYHLQQICSIHLLSFLVWMLHHNGHKCMYYPILKKYHIP